MGRLASVQAEQIAVLTTCYYRTITPALLYKQQEKTIYSAHSVLMLSHDSQDKQRLFITHGGFLACNREVLGLNVDWAIRKSG
jgi:hypothetical protein